MEDDAKRRRTALNQRDEPDTRNDFGARKEFPASLSLGVTPTMLRPIVDPDGGTYKVPEALLTESALLKKNVGRITRITKVTRTRRHSEAGRKYSF